MRLIESICVTEGIVLPRNITYIAVLLLCNNIRYIKVLLLCNNNISCVITRVNISYNIDRIQRPIFLGISILLKSSEG